MVPTARALALASPIRNSLAQLGATLREQRGFDPSSSRKVFTISVTDYIEFLLFGPLLRYVASDGPQIQIKSCRPDQLFFIPEAALREGAVDAAIGIFPNPVSTSSEIRTQTLIDEENVCIARQRHPTIKGRLTLEKFAASEHVGIFYRDHGPGLVDSSLETLEFHRRLNGISRHFLSVPFIVAASDLIAVVPKRIATTFRKFLPLRVFELPFSLPKFPVKLVWLERNQNDSAQIWLRQKILQATRDVSVKSDFKLRARADLSTTTA